MALTIRRFTPNDYETACAICNAALPEEPVSPSEWRERDAHRDPKCGQDRWFADVDGKPVGLGSWQQFEWLYHPDKYFLMFSVLPEHQNQGIGSALYDVVLNALRERDAAALRAFAREDRPAAVRFLGRRGFVEEDRMWESRLDTARLDLSRWNGAEDRPRAHGITIKTVGELESDSHRDRKLYEMVLEVMEDVPMPEPFTAPSFEVWKKQTLDTQNFLPDGQFVAVQGDEYVGISQLYATCEDDLDTGLTGVRRAWRRKGVALALKLRAARYARDHGGKTIRTDNSTVNRPMLSINEAMGFEKQPVTIFFKNTLREIDAPAGDGKDRG